jgi:hypothetical protein
MVYPGNSGALVIDGGLTVIDADSENLSSASVSITSGFQSGQDVLGFENQNGITGAYSADTGILTLTGTASTANYQTAFRSVTYQNTIAYPNAAARVITFVASDGTVSGSASRQILVGGIEGWRTKYFSQSDLVDVNKEATLWGNNADPDGDGRNNLMEYALGSNPTKSELFQGVSVEIKTIDGMHVARITFKKLKTDSTLLYVPEVSTDRQSWISESSHIQLLSASSLSDEFDSVIYQTVGSVGPGNPIYLRLKVDKP